MNRFRLADVSFLLGAVVGVLVLGVPWTYVDAQETSSSEITNFAPVPATGQQDCWDENGTPIYVLVPARTASCSGAWHGRRRVS